MNSQIMENVIQYYLHVYDSALRIYSQNKSEYRTANYLYCGHCMCKDSFIAFNSSENIIRGFSDIRLEISMRGTAQLSSITS